MLLIESTLNVLREFGPAIAGLATLVLAFFVYRVTNSIHKSIRASAESRWTPEFVQYFSGRICDPNVQDPFMAFRKNRGWSPQIRIVTAEKVEEWFSPPVANESIAEPDVTDEYRLMRPQKLSTFFLSLQDGEYSGEDAGELWIKYHSTLGYEHRLKYQIEFEVREGCYEITSVDLLERLLPWER